MSRISNNGVLNSLTVSFLLIILLGSVVTYGFMSIPVPITEVKEKTVLTSRAKVDTQLKVQLYRNGELIDTRIKPDDILTKQFIDFWGAMFSGVLYSGTTFQQITMKNDANTDKTITVSKADTGTTACFSDSSSGSAIKGGFIGIGTGSTAPARSNYALEAKVEGYAGVDLAYPTWDATSGNVTIVGKITLTSNRNITEACLGVTWIDASAVSSNFVMAHDTFATVSGSTSDIVVITYIIHLGNEFTSNMGRYIASMFKQCADGATVTVATVTLSNGGENNYFYGTNYNYLTANRASDYQMCYFMIGTGTNAIARSNYALQTMVEVANAPTTIVDSTGFTSTGVINCLVTRNITEFGVYLRRMSSASTVIRFKFDAVNVPASNTIVCELRVDF